MKYCLKVITKDGDVSNYYFSSQEELDYNAVYCQYSDNITKAIGMKVWDFQKQDTL